MNPGNILQRINLEKRKQKLILTFAKYYMEEARTLSNFQWTHIEVDNYTDEDENNSECEDPISANKELKKSKLESKKHNKEDIIRLFDLPWSLMKSYFILFQSMIRHAKLSSPLIN